MSEKKRSRQVSSIERNNFIGWLAVIHGCEGENIQATANRLGVAPGTVRSWLAGRSVPSLMAYRLIKATYDSVVPCDHCHGSGKVLPKLSAPTEERLGWKKQYERDHTQRDAVGPTLPFVGDSMVDAILASSTGVAPTEAEG